MKTIKSSSIISVLFLLGILVMINVIGVRNFLRLDLTSSKMYSLTKASKDIAARIPDKLLVKAYFSPDLPSPYNNYFRYLRDILEDYKAYSKGHIEYEFIDPGSELALQEEAQSFQIPPRRFQTVENDKIEVKVGYMGVVFIYGDKKEVIPVIDGISNIEYEITSLINRLTAVQLTKLGIASTGTEEESVTMQEFYESLGRNFDLLPLSMDGPIDPGYDGVLLIAPRLALTDWQLFNLDQYIINGGKIGILASSYEVFFQQQYASLRDLNLDGFLRNYGIAINNDMLIDDRSAMIEVPMQQGVFTFKSRVKLPYLPNINNLNKENVITRDLGFVQTYFPSSIDTTLAAGKGFEIEGLMYTSDLSNRQRGPAIRLEITRQWTENDYLEKQIPMAAIVKGQFNSYFAESGPPPKPVAGSPAGVDSMEVATEPYDGPFKSAADAENRILVIGDGNMALDLYATTDNIVFLQNVADWLVQEEDLIAIRSKYIMLNPLKEIPNFAKKFVKWGNHIGPVIMVIILGIMLWQVRRLKKNALEVQ